MTAWSRGTLSDTNSDGVPDTVASAARSHPWGLDPLGNWGECDDGQRIEERTHNPANEVTSIWIEQQQQGVTPAYDAGGNMTSGPRPGSDTTRLHFTYDGWNRLTEVRADDEGEPGDLVASYEYDGLGRRIVKTVGTGESAVRADYYYDESWQVVEERTTSNQQPATLTQYVWDARYIDAPVLRDKDTDGNGTFDQRLYYTTDANWNVTALVDGTVGSGTFGQMVERYSYTPYGRATLHDGFWNERPGGSAYGNEIQYAGYRFDPETGLYQVRNRYYHPTLGRFANRDPIRYAGGANLYGYSGQSPTGATDPTGLLVHENCSCPVCEFAKETDRWCNPQNWPGSYNGLLQGPSVPADSMTRGFTGALPLEDSPAAVAAEAGWKLGEGVVGVVQGVLSGARPQSQPQRMASAEPPPAPTVPSPESTEAAGIRQAEPAAPSPRREYYRQMGEAYVKALAARGMLPPGERPPGTGNVATSQPSTRPSGEDSKWVVQSVVDRTYVVDMREAPDGSGVNAAGYKRNGPWFWRQMLEKHPHLFGREDVLSIKAGKAPSVSAEWIKYHPAHAPYANEKLIHHHIEQGPIASGLPERVHQGDHGPLHPER
jgi:RHS repeat-associated protein